MDTKFGSKFKIRDAVRAPRGYEEVYYLENEAFCGKQAAHKVWNGLKGRGKRLTCVFFIVVVGWLRDTAKLKVPVHGLNLQQQSGEHQAF